MLVRAGPRRSLSHICSSIALATPRPVQAYRTKETFPDPPVYDICAGFARLPQGYRCRVSTEDCSLLRFRQRRGRMSPFIWHSYICTYLVYRHSGSIRTGSGAPVALYSLPRAINSKKKIRVKRPMGAASPSRELCVPHHIAQEQTLSMSMTHRSHLWSLSIRFLKSWAPSTDLHGQCNVDRRVTVNTLRSIANASNPGGGWRSAYLKSLRPLSQP